MIRKLQYFNAVVELGSLSKASRLFDVQPSSISRQIAALEEELATTLINRDSRTLSLTEAGQAFYSYSQDIVASLDEAKRTINDLQGSPKGVLVVSATVGYGEQVVLPLICEFQQRYPDIKLKLELTERVINLVEENVDVAIRSGSLNDSALIAKKLEDNEFLICASPAYLAKYGRPNTPADLLEHSCIKYGYSGWNHWYLRESKKPEKLQLVNTLEVNTVNGQRQLMLNDAGVALIPRWAVKDELAEGALEELLQGFQLDAQPVDTAIYAIYMKREMLSAKIRVFLDFLAEKLAQSD